VGGADGSVHIEPFYTVMGFAPSKYGLGILGRASQKQVVNVARTTVVQDAWARGQTLRLHGWVYGLHDGLLRDLGLTLEAPSQVVPRFRSALAPLSRDAQPRPDR